MKGAAVLREQALAAAASGHRAEAIALFDHAAAAFPDDPALLNSIGNFHAQSGDAVVALEWFDRALAIVPDHHEAAVNRGVVLTRLGRSREAHAWLADREAELGRTPRYWSARGAAALAIDDPVAAGRAYDHALRWDGRNSRALTGRAAAALARGDEAAVVWYERALAEQPGDPHLACGLSRALAAAGRVDEALQWADAIARNLPDWIEGLQHLASLRWESGDRTGFCDPFALAARRFGSPTIVAAWVQMLIGVDRYAEAADVAAQGRRLHPDDTSLALLEAMASDSAGDDVRAGAIYAGFGISDPEWDVHRARHAIRTGDPAAADGMLATAISRTPDDIVAWSLRDVAWRMLDDARHEWLSFQPGMIRDLTLDVDPGSLTLLAARLDQLHDRSAMPVGQSVKDGSQTRGALFARADPVLATVRSAIDRALAQYRDGLPPCDDAHPLLRHRDAAWDLYGSWSIRLNGQGRHASHIHPRGVVSSAAYVVVPDSVDADGAPGWLELGRPPSDLRTGLPAVATVRPVAGHCVLFPSTLFHGTRPIRSGKRMTIAFDVGLARP